MLEKFFPDSPQFTPLPNENHLLGDVLATQIDRLDIAVWQLDRTFRIVSCNAKALEIYGKDIVGRLCHDVIGEKTPCARCPVLEVYATSQPRRAERRHRDRHGGKLWVEHIATPIITGQNTVSGVLTLLVNITPQKAAAAKLQKEKEHLEDTIRENSARLMSMEGKFAVAFDASPDAININRLEDGLYIEVNQGFCTMTGYRPDEVVGRTSLDIDIWVDQQDRQKLTACLREKGVCENLEARFRRRDGSITTALMSARIITIDKIPHILSITRDISRLKELEHENTARKLLFETMFNAIEEGIIVTDRQQSIQLANTAMKTTFGYEARQLLGRSPEFLADGAFFPEVGDSPPQRFTMPCKHRSGHSFAADTSITALYNDNKWIGNLAIFRDVSEQRKNEKERDKLITAVEQSGEAIVITDPAGTIEYVNPTFEAVTGYGKEEVLGHNPSILKSGEHDHSFYQHLWDTITAGRTFKGRMVNKTKDGRLYTEDATISPVMSAEGRIVNFIGVKRDITHQLRLEQQLLQAQKMEAIGQLTGGVAHDFNNILGVILGYAEMALAKVPTTDELHGDLLAIIDAGEKSATIVRQLLAFSRQQTISPRRLDLNETVEGMMKMLARLIGEDIELRWIRHPHSLPVKMDASQVDQILANLCVNAKDAIVGSGTITIESGSADFDESYCAKHLGFAPGDYAMLAVSDDGSGIDRADLDHVFEPFFTTKQLGRGTGLGLSTVYGIVKQNNGFINIYSEKEEGTSIKMYFPLCAGENTASAHDQKQPPAPSGIERILLVEDDEDIRKMVEKMLTKLGYDVYATNSPIEAIGLVKERVRFDLLLTDVVLPELNGKELAAALQEMLPQLRCLYISGYTTNVIAEKGILRQNVHFLQKPFSKSTLALKIREVLGEGTDEP